VHAIATMQARVLGCTADDAAAAAAAVSAALDHAFFARVRAA